VDEGRWALMLACWAGLNPPLHVPQQTNLACSSSVGAGFNPPLHESRPVHKPQGHRRVSSTSAHAFAYPRNQSGLPNG